MTRTPSFRKQLFLAATTALGVRLLSELRVGPTNRELTDRWRNEPVSPRGDVALGMSFRPRQCEEFDLDPERTLTNLLAYPFELLRLGAYWDKIEPAPGAFRHDEMDWQLDAAERAGKRVIVCLGAVKSFGYPEYFVPSHCLEAPLPEGRVIDGESHPELLGAATDHLARLVRRYRERESIIAWQVEHEAVDPLGLEHSWRLARSFVQREVEVVRATDPSRPILLNGFLPTSTVVGAHQWWRTRDQGDSLVVARQLADIVGIDCYPRHALTGLGPMSLYMDGAHSTAPRRRLRRLLSADAAPSQEVMVTEGQAEPWEAVTVPPNPDNRAPASCPPEQLIRNYNHALRWSRRAGLRLSAYLFWGAEYWVMRHQRGDSSYLDAFVRVLEDS